MYIFMQIKVTLIYVKASSLQFRNGNEALKIVCEKRQQVCQHLGITFLFCFCFVFCLFLFVFAVVRFLLLLFVFVFS